MGVTCPFFSSSLKGCDFMNLCDKFVFRLLRIFKLVKIFFTHDKLETIVRELELKLIMNLRQSGITKIVLVGIGKGGIQLFNRLNRIDFNECGITLLGTDIIYIKKYLDCSTNKYIPKIVRNISKEATDIINCNRDCFAVVIVDDLSASGKTLGLTEDFFLNRFGHLLKLRFCYLINKKCLFDRKIIFDKSIFARMIETNLFLIGFGSDFYGDLRDINLVFGVPKWFYYFLGRNLFLRKYFITLIERYSR